MGAGEIQAEDKEKPFPRKDSERGERAALRGCVASALGGFQAPTRPGCGEPRASPASGRGLD